MVILRQTERSTVRAMHEVDEQGEHKGTNGYVSFTRHDG